MDGRAPRAVATVLAAELRPRDPRLWGFDGSGLLAVLETCGVYEGMSEHKVTLRWERGGAEFVYQKYPRDHTWSFDGGHTMTATAALLPIWAIQPTSIPKKLLSPHSPVATCSPFSRIACKQKFVLDDYNDEAVGHMEKNAEGRLAITRVELHPKITWSGEKKPTRGGTG